MYKIFLKNNKVYEDCKWSELDDSPIEKIEYYPNETSKVVFSGFEKYIILEEYESIIGVSGQKVNHMSILGKHKNKCYQFTQNLIWKVVHQRINDWGNEYTPMEFKWKQQKWQVLSGRQLNRSMFHDGVIGTPTVKPFKL